MQKKGFALFISLVIMGTLLFIATQIINLAFKQSLITVTGKESQDAFYAADAGMECAIYWDVHNPSGVSAFATSTGSTIYCNKDGANASNQWIVGGSDSSSFTMTFLPDPYCVTVTVTKNGDNSTILESKGYNTCSNSDPHRVERAVRATY